MNLTKLSEKANQKETHLKQHLKLLKNSDLVTQQNFGQNKIFFEVTERGLTVLKMFMPQITEFHETQISDLKAIKINP